jgi:hypothetical protein
MKSRHGIIPLVAVGLYVAGCAQNQVALREGPRSPTTLHIESGTFDGQPAKRVVTPHYVINTTIEDDVFIASLGQLMEGALEQYHRFAPGVPLSREPMACHVFASRSQWAGFTKGSAGTDAEVYLQINRGGYTAGDKYVAYFIGDVGTWSVAAHEGWHQFVARHFKRRPPPFLEEGLACMFEDLTWDDALPRWDLSANHTRVNGVKRTLEHNAMIPLDQLCTMHAGQVVNTGPARIEAFYAESWAFARFLWDGNDRKYRPALQALLNDLATGEPTAVSLAGVSEAGWDPKSARPLLEHYLGKDLSEIEREYLFYLHHVAAG